MHCGEGNLLKRSGLLKIFQETERREDSLSAAGYGIEQNGHQSMIEVHQRFASILDQCPEQVSRGSRGQSAYTPRLFQAMDSRMGKPRYNFHCAIEIVQLVTLLQRSA